MVLFNLVQTHVARTEDVAQQIVEKASNQFTLFYFKEHVTRNCVPMHYVLQQVGIHREHGIRPGEIHWGRARCWAILHLT